ncbi:MAG: DUF1465 family protein [Hyphomicrobiales bacterium]|nr:DUF1465 family protein [Hyphomicrobiales bacterium]
MTIKNGDMIRFGDRLVGSENFNDLFRDGMALVEETATYLDGRGREDSRVLGRPESLTYATESMRLTTRLMQIASWLLLQRAVNDGEMTREQASEEKSKVRLNRSSDPSGGDNWPEMPGEFRTLVERSLRLQERVCHLDDVIYGDEGAPERPENPVAAQHGRLAKAFGRLADDETD